MRILAPHKDQDGYVYVRVRKYVPTPDNPGLPIGGVLEIGRRIGDWAVRYHDEWRNNYGSRVISSRRVEEAVETADYLKRCVENHVEAVYHNDMWYVRDWDREGEPLYDETCVSGETLREAYHRWMNANPR